ncbi:MAG: FAD binding domain-containing protein [Candidatus Solibacter usitatus]|nr:FAD binding domain-containing protein [Candidatus Solibacter usitatus]
MKSFDYAAPRSLAEALRLLSFHPRARLLAGGTDILVQMRAGRIDTDFLLDTKGIPELNELKSADGLTIGAAVPCFRIHEDSRVRSKYPALSDVAGLIGGTQIQSRATFGGNVCNAAPSADATPILIAQGATCRIIGTGGQRTVPIELFCTAPGKNVLKQGEILISFHIPAKSKTTGAQYLRFIPRNEMDIAVVGAGVEVALENGVVQSARIALSAVAPVPLFVPAAGDSMVGKAPSAEVIAEAAAIARDAATPISDMRGTVEYRRHLCAVLTRRALEAAIVRAGGKN